MQHREVSQDRARTHQQLGRLGRIFDRQGHQHRHDISRIKPGDPVYREVGDATDPIQREEYGETGDGEKQQDAIIAPGKAKWHVRRLRKKLVETRGIMKNQHA